MEIEDLLTKLRAACEEKSLRKVAQMCKVSHETIRNLIADSDDEISISFKTFRKIEKALSDDV